MIKIEGKNRFQGAKWEENPRIIGESLGRPIVFLGRGKRPNQFIIGLLQSGQTIEDSPTVKAGTLDELAKFGNAPINLTEDPSKS